jgi:DNA-binding NarL/FixJ family response regulator
MRGRRADIPVRVLIVDDDEGFRGLVKRLLGEAVKVVGEAGNGAEALWLARELHPDVVLMDLSMPLLDGLETTRRIKAEQSEVKVILMTGHGEEAYLSATGKSGADAFLPKRKVRSEVLSMVRDAAPFSWGK